MQERQTMRDQYGDLKLGWSITFLVIGVVIVLSSIGFAIVVGQRHFGRINCRNWGTITHRHTQFRILTTLDGGTCFVRQANGKWIPKEQLRDIQP